MKDDDRLDLLALHVGRDPAHWRAVLSTTLRRVDTVLAERARRQDPLQLIAEWVRPVLLAAAVAIAVLVPVEFALERREANAVRVQQLVSLSTAWAHGGQQPSGAELLRTMSGVRAR